MSSRRRLILRMTIVAAVVAVIDLFARSVVTANLTPHQRVSLGAGFRVVADQQRSGLVTPSSIAALGALILVLVASRHGVVRRTLWVPMGLLFGAGIATTADLLEDGRITRWFDPPLSAALSWGDLALVAGLLGLVYALGEFLGGVDPGPSGTALRARADEVGPVIR